MYCFLNVCVLTIGLKYMYEMKGDLVEAAEREVHPVLLELPGEPVLHGLHATGVGYTQPTEEFVALNN